MVMGIQTLYTLLSLPHTHTPLTTTHTHSSHHTHTHSSLPHTHHTHTHTLLTTTHIQLLQLQQATQGATANNSFGLGTSLGNSKPSEPIHDHSATIDPSHSPFPSDLALAALAQQSTGTIGVSSAPTSYTTSSATGGWVHVPHLLSSSSLLSTPPFPPFFVPY